MIDVKVVLGKLVFSYEGNSKQISRETLCEYIKVLDTALKDYDLFHLNPLNLKTWKEKEIVETKLIVGGNHNGKKLKVKTDLKDSYIKIFNEPTPLDYINFILEEVDNKVEIVEASYSLYKRREIIIGDMVFIFYSTASLTDIETIHYLFNNYSKEI